MNSTTWKNYWIQQDYFVVTFLVFILVLSFLESSEKLKLLSYKICIIKYWFLLEQTDLSYSESFQMNVFLEKSLFNKIRVINIPK